MDLFNFYNSYNILWITRFKILREYYLEFYKKKIILTIIPN